MNGARQVPKRVQKARSKPRAEQGAPLSRHEERRIEAERRMLDAAVEILAEHGVDGLTLADVGIAAGYSRGLPAHYFSNKAGLLEAVAGYVTVTYAAMFAALPASKSGMPTLVSSVRKYLALDADTRHWAVAIQSIYAESLIEPGLAPAALALTKRATDTGAARLREALANGEIRGDVDPQRYATMILGTLRTIVSLWLVDPRLVPLDQVAEAFIASLKRDLAV